MTTEAETKVETPAPADVPVKEEVKSEAAKEEKADQDTEKETKVEEKKEEKKKPTPAAKPTCHKPDYEKDTVYLFQFSRTPVLPSISPFCLKTETFLRVAGIKYENVDHRMKLRSKKGQLPFVELNGEEIADSAFIVRELSSRFGKDLDAELTAEQRNHSFAMVSMVENHLFWIHNWWISKAPSRLISGYRLDLQKLLGTRLPAALLNLGLKLKMRSKSKTVKAMGLGVHRPEEIEELGKNDLKALSDQLADRPFFFGDEPTLLDVVAFAHVAQLIFLDKQTECPLRTYIEENHTNLVGHANRIKERFYPDWEEMCESLDLNTHLPKPPPKQEEKKEEEAVEEKKEEEAAGDAPAEKEKVDEDKEKEEDNKQTEASEQQE